MAITRRKFIGTTTLTGIGFAMLPWLSLDEAMGSVMPHIPGATGERISTSPGWFYRVYRARASHESAASTWVQIDLGSSQPIDAVKLYPSNGHFAPGDGFPLRFCIECSDDAAFHDARVIIDWSKSDFPDTTDHIIEFRANRVTGRYVRLRVTHLRSRKMPVASFLAAIPAPLQQSIHGTFLFALSKIEVLSAGTDLALHRRVTVDPTYGNPEDAQQLTRSPRPQGEGIVTNNPQNVSSPDNWRAVHNQARIPLAGVQMQDGILMTAMQNNIRYLLDSFSVDDLLRQFRERAGKPVPITTRKPDPFWEEDLAGSNAGRFLMGAGNTLHWIEHDELHDRVNAVIEGIAECRQANGYIMAYKEDTFFVSDRGAYTRAWLTLGLIEAGYLRNSQTLDLLRGYYDWYNQRPYLSNALRACDFGGCGMVANTRMYFTQAGKPEDIHVLQRYFQEDYWMEDLAARKVDSVWQYPYDRPHCYLLMQLEGYLDLYRATGDQRYLNAVLGAWDLFHENWQNVGGSISIIEMQKNPPKSNSLYERLGENCGSAFWILLNHGLHLLYPGEEKYVTEIERSIYNVLLANQSGSEGFRYHTMLVGRKEKPTRINTCCEGQGTRLVGTLPQYIYSISDDGIYVNLFEPSTVAWQQSGKTIRLTMETSFPKSVGVKLTLHVSTPVHSTVRVRVPSWSTGPMNIEINGVHAAVGTPGSYIGLDRLWSNGDMIAFTLPMAMKLTKYEGVDQIEGRERFALEYGPILMATLGGADTELALMGAASPMDLIGRLQPVANRPLHFKIEDPFGPEMEFMPYFEIEAECFSCVPIIEAKASILEL